MIDANFYFLFFFKTFKGRKWQNKIFQPKIKQRTIDSNFSVDHSTLLKHRAIAKNFWEGNEEHL